MILLLLLQINLQAYAKTYYHKDRDIRPVLEKASVIRNHSLQIQTRNMLAQVYSNLDAREIEAMRSKAVALVKARPDKAYYDIENETDSELLYIYLQAVKQIPDAEVVSTYYPKLRPKPREDFWGNEVPVDEPLSLTDNQAAKAFRVHGSTVDFVVNNKLYRISPNLFGRTYMHLLSSDAQKYKAAKDKCFDTVKKLSDSEDKKKCEDFRNASLIEYRIRNKTFTIDGDNMEFFVTPSFSHTGTGSVRLADDKVSNSAFTAAMLQSDLMDSYYINGNKIDLEFTVEQEAMIRTIQIETTSPTTSSTTNLPAPAGAN
jgi:hypothetical protein